MLALCRRLFSKKPPHLQGKTVVFPEPNLPDAYESILDGNQKKPFKDKKDMEKHRQRETRKIYKPKGGEPWYQ